MARIKDNATTVDGILRLPMVMELTGLSSATIYRKIAEGSFPRSVRLGKNSVGWRESEFQAWIEGLEYAGPAPKPVPPLAAQTQRVRSPVLPHEATPARRRQSLGGKTQ